MLKYRKVCAILAGVGIFASGYVSGHLVSSDSYAKNTESTEDVVYSSGYEEVVPESSKTDVVKYSTRYVADKTKEIGTREVVQSGKDGSKITYTVDGEYKEVLNPPVTEIISVGTLDTVNVETPFEKETRENSEKWDNYKGIVQEGKNRVEQVTMAYDVDPKTGEMVGSSAEKIDSQVVEEGSSEICEVGTKEPIWTEVVDTGETLPFGVEYVAVDDGSLDFGEVSVVSQGKPGSSSTVYDVACDENGNILEGYEKKERENPLVSEPVNETRKVGTYREEEVAIEPEVKYKGVSEKVGYENVLEEGVPGLKNVISVFSLQPDGTMGDAIKEDEEIIKKAKDKIVQVGTIESKEEVLKFKSKIKTDNTKPEGYEKVETEGKDGSATVTYKYTIDEDTGKVTSEEVISKIIHSESVTEVKTVGTLKPEDMEYFGVETSLKSGEDDYTYILSENMSESVLAKDEEELRSKIDSELKIKDSYGNDMKYELEVDESIYGNWLTGNTSIVLHPVGKGVEDIVLDVLV